MTPDRRRAEAEIKAVEDALRAGYSPTGLQGRKDPSAIRVAADALGIDPTSLKHRVGSPDRPGLWLREYGIAPDWTIEPALDQFTTYEQIHAPAKPRIRVKAWTNAAPDGPIVSVLGIGDVHCKPGRTTEHLTWVGRHAAATSPDRIVCIGDFLSLDSLSNHPPKGSGRDSERPSFPDDLEAGEEALHALDKECPELPKDITFGNHERRAWTAADMDPRRAGDFPLRVEQLFARYRWKTHLYGKMLYIAACGFVHVPLNQMGREYGGKNSENTIGNDATHSIVWGHDHRFRTKTVPKIGPNNKISLCNLGTCMPFGTVEDYNVGTTGWSYGVVDLRLQAGLIVSAKFHDLLELRQRYGN